MMNNFVNFIIYQQILNIFKKRYDFMKDNNKKSKKINYMINIFVILMITQQILNNFKF